MKLKSILIKQFKSIKEIKIDFSDTLYCLVGQNEIGKSNILQAISMLDNFVEKSDVEKKAIGIPKNGEYIEGVFTLDAQENEMLRSVTKSLNLQLGSYNTLSVHSIKLTCNRAAIGLNHFSFLIDKQEVPLQSISDINIRDSLLKKLIKIIPKIEYYTNEDFALNPFSLKEFLDDKKNPSFQSFKKLFELGGITDIASFANLQDDEIIYQRETAAEKINFLLNQYYKSDYQLQIKIESHNGVFTVFFNDKYKKLDSLTQRSSGVQYFFAFLINKLHAKTFGRIGTIYLIDEPALSLHPTSQKKFIRLLEEFSKENMVIYTTHSPFLINRLRPSRVWVIERNNEQGTFINHKPSHHNWRPLRSSLGMDFSDSFFYGDKTLLVEGPEDKIIIGALIQYFSRKGSITLNSDLLSIIDAGSISNMPAMVQILIDENRPMFVLMDNDDTRILNRLKAKANQINNKEVLSLKTISDVKSDAISIEDILPLNIYIESISNFIQYLLDEKIIALKPSQKFSISVPENLQKIYSSLAKQIITLFNDSDGIELDSKVPISKVGVAHEFEKIIESKPNLGSNEEEETCLKLVKLIAANLKLA